MSTPLERAGELEARAREGLERLFGPERTAALLATLRRRLGRRDVDALVLALGVVFERRGGRHLYEVGALREVTDTVDRYLDRFGG